MYRVNSKIHVFKVDLYESSAYCVSEQKAVYGISIILKKLCVEF